jgi:glycosyltransferase involved in cell wall biosynthesis
VTLKFDIILPTIGRDSLRQSIQSVIDQTYQNWLLWIIVDQVNLFNAWPSSLDKRIICWEIVTCPANNDWGARARNFGICKGERRWITYIDDDDEWLPHHLSTIDRLIKDNPGVNMIRTAGQSFKLKHKSPRSSQLVRKMGAVNSTDILTVGMAHTRGIFGKTQGWQPCDNHDHLLWREMLVAGGIAIESKEVTFHFSR